MNKYVQHGLITTLLLSLVACGGSSGGKKSSSSSTSSSSVQSSSTQSNPASSESSSSSSSQADTLTGVFLDNAVAGISYSTETKSGVTNSLGEYDYVEGETVTFYIGDLALPPVPAKGVVTPADIAKANHSDELAINTTKTNILQLLQTLDQDGDPANGIQISEAATAKFTGDDLPDITSTAFDTDVAAFLPTGSTLVKEDDALAHFDNTLKSQLLGSWLYSEGEGKRNLLTFVDSSRYIIIHEHDDDDTQEAGSVEFGSYSWDPEAGKLAVTLIGQSDNNGGLWSLDNAENGVVTHTLTVSGSELVLGTPSDGQAVFSRVINRDSSLIGAWVLDEASDENLNVLTFLSDTEYVIAHTNNQESYSGASNQPLSGEFGSYTFSNGHFQVTGAHVDTDGDGGLFNAEDSDDQSNESMSFTTWGDLLFKEEDEGTFSFARIGSFAVNLQDYDNTRPLGTILATRDATGFSTNYLAGKSFSTGTINDGSNSVFSFHFGEANDEGVGIGSISVEGDDGDETVEIEWQVNSAGTVLMTFSDGEESFVVALAKLANSSDSKPKILFAIESEEESSLWETTLTMAPLL